MLRSLLNWQLLYSKQSSFFRNKTMDRSVGIRLQGGFFVCAQEPSPKGKAI